MKHKEQLEFARKLADILIADGVVTSVVVHWSIEDGVSVRVAIGQLWIAHKPSANDLAFAQLETLAGILTHKLRKGWEEQTAKTKAHKAPGRS